MKERMLTVLVPIKDSDVAGTYSNIMSLISAIPPDEDGVNRIYKVGNMLGGSDYYRVWLNPATNQYEYHVVIDREFPYIGKPLEIFDFTYDATRMGNAPTITAQGVMWFADKDADGNDVTLEDLWLARNNDCHVSFNGENFYLKQVPTCSKDNEDERYKYDIDFVSGRVVLERVYLYDVVQPFVTERPISESAQFSFFGDVSELAKRINASLLRSGLAELELRDNQAETVHPRLLADGITHAADDQFFTYDEWNAISVGNYSGPLSTTDPYSAGEELPVFHKNVFDHYGGDYNAYLRNEVYLLDSDGEMIMSGYICKIGKDKKGELTTSEEKLITFDKNTIHEALQEVHDKLGLQYYIYSEKNSNGDFTGNTIIMIADCEHDFADVTGTDADGNPIYSRDADGIPTTGHPFNYGVDNELLFKEKTNTTDKIVTRITGVGSEENIPWYYPNPTADGWIRPIYSRGDTVLDEMIEYPLSEENVLYEKYLKNRIGNNFYFGRLYNIIQANRSAGSADGFKQSTVLVSGNAAELLCIINITESETFVEFDVSAVSSITNTYIVKKDGVSYTPSFSFLNGKGFLPTGRYIITYDFLAEEGHNFIEDTFTIYYYYRGRSWAETGLSTNGNLVHHYVREGRDDYDEWWTDQNGNTVTLITPQIRTFYYIYHDNNPSNNQLDCLYFTASGRSYEHITEATLMGSAEFIQNVMKGDIRLYNGDGWYMSNKKKVNLADYGLSNIPSNSNCMVGDTIEFQRVKYITPQPTLMPKVYVKTDGERRFYNAVNYPLSGGTPDPMIGEEESGGQIINPIYQKEDSTVHYDFENEYIRQRPHEHIEQFEDVKPSIKGQINTVDGQSFRIDVVEEFAYDELDDDDVWENNDNGNISGEYKHPYFFAKLRPLGFNIFDLALQEDMVLSMTTGHCGACNFKIGVDENTKKNPVQIWEYDVYEGPDYATKVLKYTAGTLRRVVDTSNLYYDKTPGDATGYVLVDTSSSVRVGFLVDEVQQIRTASFERRTYSALEVVNGEVGALRREGKNHFAGDVVTNGRFIESQQDTTEDYVWVALMKDTDTYGVIMPSARPDYADNNYSVYIRPKSVADTTDEDTADNFVLTNIRMPQVYLRRAERELSRRIVAYMYDNNFQKFNFSIKFSRIFLAQNLSIDADLNENSVLYVSFNNRTYRQYVKHYTYRMTKDAVLPEISVDMNEELSVSRTQVERTAIAAARVSDATARRIRSSISSSEERMSRRTIGRNQDVLVDGNIVSRDAVTSFSELQTARKESDGKIFDTQLDLEINHFKKSEFEVFNGTDLKIGDSLFLPTAYKDGKSIKRRVWSESEKTFVSDSDGTFSPAFIDKANERIVQYMGNGEVDTQNIIQPATKSSFQSFVSQVNAFNTSVASNILRIRYTVEERTGLTQSGGCTSIDRLKEDQMPDLKDNVGVAFWLDSSGESVRTSSACPAPVSVTWTDFNIT